MIPSVASCKKTNQNQIKQETSIMFFSLKQKVKIKLSSLFVIIANNPDQILLKLIKATSSDTIVKICIKQVHSN